MKVSRLCGGKGVEMALILIRTGYIVFSAFFFFLQTIRHINLRYDIQHNNSGIGG